MAILVGPVFSPPEFSWIRHSTSEQVGQFVSGAWIMRIGFIAYGIATIGASLLDRNTRPFVHIPLVIFGVGLIAAAIWSDASFMPNVSSDMREDSRHSIALNIVGIAFATACLARLFAPGGSSRDPIVWAGLLASVAVSIAMNLYPDTKGLTQCIMFAVSFLFMWREFRDSSTEDQ